MNVPTSGKRVALLRQGLDLVTVHGFAGVSLGMLAEHTGRSKSGLFAHFGSKEDLQLGLLDQTSREFEAAVLEGALREAPGLPRLERAARLWLGWPARAGLTGGCPVAAGLFELDDQPGPLRDRLLNTEREWRALLATWTREAVTLGQLRPDLDPEQFVWELCGLYLAHHVSRRFVQDEAADERAERALSALLARSRPAG
ncbi:TetR/AcrR family transcriptional regulator [Deinococcus sp. HMF7604]|uniref:TetR/AcrR family transcriptional regulator n=1 Tax=Deinococcus betulae TaxID=2873312 RepID=UPI001CCE1992|nr:TetR/AcrR family transcriptional regulator [Deinococcus betulae]MBZ9751116.1 TetR/AcrR family transcriptional regulator [Deinococcus betulae]